MMKNYSLNNDPSYMSGYDLIVAIQITDNNRILNQLQTEFFERYRDYVYKAACRICSSFPDVEDTAVDITQETFIKAFNNLNSFQLPKLEISEKSDKLIKAWLGKIGNNIFFSLYEKRKNFEYINEAYDEIASYDDFDDCQDIEDYNEFNNEFEVKLAKAFEKLSEREQYIILRYANENCIGSGQHLSQNEIESLCNYYKTNAVNIRQIKKRALDKLKRYLKDA